MLLIAFDTSTCVSSCEAVDNLNLYLPAIHPATLPFVDGVVPSQGSQGTPATRPPGGGERRNQQCWLLCLKVYFSEANQRSLDTQHLLPSIIDTIRPSCQKNKNTRYHLLRKPSISLFGTYATDQLRSGIITRRPQIPTRPKLPKP